MKYKKIIIEEHLLTDDEKFIVQNIENNKLFQGLKFQIEDNNLVLLLNSIDLNQFKITLNNILNQYDMKLSDTIFSDVLLKIESIGSYGIKSGKRLFVDYDKERKNQFNGVYIEAIELEEQPINLLSNLLLQKI